MGSMVPPAAVIAARSAFAPLPANVADFAAGIFGASTTAGNGVAPGAIGVVKLADPGLASGDSLRPKNAHAKPPASASNRTKNHRREEFTNEFIFSGSAGFIAELSCAI